jgi:hypothetical protein
VWEGEEDGVFSGEGVDCYACGVSSGSIEGCTVREDGVVAGVAEMRDGSRGSDLMAGLDKISLT